MSACSGPITRNRLPGHFRTPARIDFPARSPQEQARLRSRAERTRVDDRTTTPDAYIAPFAAWSYDDNATGWNALLGPGHEHREVDPSAAPGPLEDAAGLPPAYIEVGQLDIFRDEDVRYALTLSWAGVPVELHLQPGVPHEYDAIAFDTDVSRRAQATATACCGACDAG